LRRRSTAAAHRDETVSVDRRVRQIRKVPQVETLQVRIVRPLLVAAAFVGLSAALLPVRTVYAQESITVTEDPAMAPSVGISADPSACGCRNVQQPPWHGNVHGDHCGPACGPACGTGHGTFQANPWGQLHMRRHIKAGCVTLPPCMPRLHAMCREGYLLSPTPPTLPRCHECGAMIEGGF